FNPSIHATGSYSTIDFNKDVFAKGQSSVKAMELIIWFLFNDLDSTLTKDRFFDCWPVLTPAHSAKFRNIAYKWLEQLKKEGCLGYTDIILRRSAFDECQGERFERVVMAFSNYVVKVSLDREYQNYCQACHELWKDLANSLSERLRNVTEKTNQLEREISGFYKGKYLFETFENLSIEQLSLLRSQKLDSARSAWESCLYWIRDTQNFTDCVENIMHDRTNNHRLDGQELSLEVPEIMMTMWEKAFQKVEQINPFQGGKKDLRSLLKLWKFSLQTLSNQFFNPSTIKQLQAQELSPNKYKFKNGNLSCTLNKLEEYLPEQQEQIRSLYSLKNLLRTRLSGINESIRSLHEDEDLGNAAKKVLIGYESIVNINNVIYRSDK
ncbi:17933_t:CDS:2, partial [Funneliformis geosporum]